MSYGVCASSPKRHVQEGVNRHEVHTQLLLLVALVALPAFACAIPVRSESEGNRPPECRGENLGKLTNAPDNGIPNTILADAKCVAVIPSMVKGGFIFGAEHGRGVATCRTEKGWSAPAFFVITGGNWGAQIGVEGVDLVMLFMNQEGADKLLSAKWKVGAEVGIAAGPFGRDASANMDWKANTAILTYSRSKGVYIGADLDGANVHADELSHQNLLRPGAQLPRHPRPAR